MKIFGLDVPLPLVDLYNEYVTKQKNIGGNDYQTRRRRKAGKVLASRSARLVQEELRTAAEYIAEKLGYKKDSADWNKFVFDQTELMKNGTIDYNYWIPCQVNIDVYYNSTGSNVEDTNPPPYSYRNPTMKPSTVTYSSGTTAAAPMNTIGSVSDNLWRDASWKWRKTVFSLMGAKPAANLPPLLWRTTGNITAAATTRGSRPMFSLLMRGHLVGASSPYDTDLTPPQQPATSIYWRYPSPDTAPPYYSAKQARQAIILLNNRSTKDPGDQLQRAIVKSAPRPMLGHGFNNNASVQTTYDGTSELWTANPCIGKTSPTPIPATLTQPTPTVNSYNTIDSTIYTNKYFDAELYWRTLHAITDPWPALNVWQINPTAWPPSYSCILVPAGGYVSPYWRFITTLPRKSWIYYNGTSTVRLFSGFDTPDIYPYYYSHGQCTARIEFTRPACSK